MSVNSPRFLHEFKDTWDDHLQRTRTSIVDGYWHLKLNRQNFKSKEEDFKHTQKSAEDILEALQIFMSVAEGGRNKVGVQPYINNMVDTLNIHLKRIKEYYPKNKPGGFKTKDNQKEEAQFQREVFKGERKVKDILKDLDIDNNMESFTYKFHSEKIASLVFKSSLENFSEEIKAKIEALDLDWDYIGDKRFYINIPKKEIPDWNEKKHFWEQEKEVLQFYIGEYNKVKKGFFVDDYFVHPWLYFHINYFKTNIPSLNERGVIEEVVRNVDFRRTEWYFAEILKKAEKLNRGAIFIYGSRRIGKSVFEASKLAHKTLISNDAELSVTINNDEDRMSITDKIQTCFDNLPEFLKIHTNIDDWGKIVEVGLKTKVGRKIKHCNIRITNLDSGSKKASQKGAGGAPIEYIFDESGKADFIDSYNAVKYAFKTPLGWKTIPIYVGTGTNVDISQDAEKVLMDPEKYDFIEIDWDLLEYKIPESAITWQRRKFGWFVPGQMSYEEGLKFKEQTFGEFIGVDNPILNEVKFLDADWEYNSKLLVDNQKSLLVHDRKEYQAYCVFLPTDPEHCFMSAKNNPYRPQLIKKHRIKLQSQGDNIIGLGRKIRLYRDNTDFNKISFELTSDIASEFPHKGGFFEGPGILYDDFPETRPHDPYRFVGGLDDYKHEDSDGNSIGAFFIYDRLKHKIVYELVTRPDPHSHFHKEIRMALDAWNAMCFMENADMAFKTYLDRVSDPNLYLYKGFDAYGDFSFLSSGKRGYGWSPDKRTVPVMNGFGIDYAKEDIDSTDDEGNIIATQHGFKRIDSVQLLMEMERYKDGGNFDRIVAYNSCIAIDFYLTSKYITPTKPHKKTDDQIEVYKKPKTRNKFFTKKRSKLFGKF